MNTEHKISLLRYIASGLESEEIDGSINDGWGLCSLVGKLTEKWWQTTYYEHDARYAHCLSYAEEAREEAFRIWPRYSGSIGYPIPHPWTAEQRAEWEEKHGLITDQENAFPHWGDAAYDTVGGCNPSELPDDAPMDDEAMEQYMGWRFELRDHLVQYFRKIADELESQSQ